MKRNFSPETSDRFEYLQALVTEFQDTDSEGKNTNSSQIHLEN